jgi:hypothetical protein
MAHYEDLSPCDYFGGFLRGRTPPLAVGWLERGHAFATGDPGREVYERLGQFLWRRAWQFALTFGTHPCRLGSCRYDSFHSHRNIFIPGPGVVYVAPEGIRHYISCHDYLPPPEFCAAVLASPDEGSPEYFVALRAGGLQVDDDEPETTRQHELMSIVEARGRALVSAIEAFRRIRGRWPQRVDEVTGLVDDSHAWRYAPGPREFMLETDEQAIAACALRYESALGSWKVAVGQRWFSGS